MPIKYVTGDLFVNRFEAQALAHGCNCQGSMGAGIAKGFKERYPKMFEEYQHRCKAEPRKFNLGDSFLWQEEGKPWVFNLGAQERYWRARASYEAIENTLKQMKLEAETQGIQTIAMPRTGTGYGHLSWRKVRAIVKGVFDDWTGTLYVYEEYTPAQ